MLALRLGARTFIGQVAKAVAAKSCITSDAQLKAISLGRTKESMADTEGGSAGTGHCYGVTPAMTNVVIERAAIVATSFFSETQTGGSAA